MTTVFATDEEALSECPRGLSIRAIAGHAIVWFLPYRRTSGIIEIPDKAQPQSCEAVIIHDASEHGLGEGVKVGVSRTTGEYFEHEGHTLCGVPGSAIILVDTKYSPEL